MQRTRDFRRYQAVKAKCRARRLVRSIWRLHYDLDNPRCIGMIARTRKSCSKRCCGNPRRLFGERTIQERRMGDVVWSDD